ncbi:MAG: hypothetical protein QOF61_400 [Acidobacteriota bacterium]|nr:hypothetical protein [Acidobacteriota bacterium]
MAAIFHTHEELGIYETARVRTFMRWLGGSIVAHAVLLACLVYIPALRDTFTLANELSGFRVVSKDYERTKVEERAVLINLAAQQLYYPAGYFEVASQTAPPSPNDPKFVATVNPTPEPTPKPVKIKPTPSPSPTASPAAAEDVAKNGDGTDSKPAASPSPAEPQTVEEAQRIAKESNVEDFPEINTKPFTDLLEHGRAMKNAGEIDLSGTLDLSAEGDRQDDGRLANVVVTGGSASNPKLKQLALDFIAALSDSKALIVLKGTRHLHMKVLLDDKQIAVRVMTEMADEAEASQKSNGYNMLLYIGAKSKEGKDEEKIFKSIRVNSEAKQIVLTLQMPRADASALLTKLSEKNKTTPPGD